MTTGAAGSGASVSFASGEVHVSRLIVAIAFAITLLAAGHAKAGGYYPGYYDGYYGGGYGYGYYAPGYYGYYGGYYDDPYYPAYRTYWGPVGPIPIVSPILTAIFTPGPRCQHRVPVVDFQGEVRGGWVNGC